MNDNTRPDEKSGRAPQRTRRPAPARLRSVRWAVAAATGLSLIGGGVAAAPAAQAATTYQITLDMNECGVMAVGTTGTCVRSLQTWLNIFSRANLRVDSQFGPSTDRAVRNFQSAHGLYPDGRFGNQSRNALRGEYQYMTANSVPTPRPIPQSAPAGMPGTGTRVADERGIKAGVNAEGTGGAVITGVVCGAAGLGYTAGAAALFGPPGWVLAAAGISAGVACAIAMS